METQLTQQAGSVPATQEQLDESVRFALARAEAEERIFALEQRRMKPYAESDLVPQHYRGRLANCLIAHEMARRIGANTLSVMQNLYIVHGSPGWSAQFAISIFNTCGRFSAIKYKFDGEGDEYGCTAYATEKTTGETVIGPKITWKLVKAEGWLNKNGSKWKTLPELMFRYRAAAYLVKTTAPELLNGLQTKEELEDVYSTAKPAEGAVVEPEKKPLGGIAAVLANANAVEPPQAEEISALTPEAQDAKAFIERERAEALRKSHEAGNLGITIEGTPTQDCRPD